MGLERLSPGVQDGQEAGVSAKMPGVGGYFEQGCRTGLEQEREYAKGPAANRGPNNLHLAVGPADGETATITSNYGPVFTFEGDRRIIIPESNELRAGYGEFYYRCMNFRFGKLMYPTNLTGPEAPKTPILKAR